MTQYYGIKNLTKNHCISGDWHAAPPSPQHMQYFIGFFGWNVGDYILCGSPNATFAWNWELDAWSAHDTVMPIREKRYAAPPLPNYRSKKIAPAKNESLVKLEESFNSEKFFK
jgi:hypothetical protein